MRKQFFFSISLFLLGSDALAQTAAIPSMTGNLVQMFLALTGVLALLLGGLWWLKKLTSNRSATGLMRVVGATAVGGRERVVIVEIGSTWLVLGVAPGRVSALAEVPRQSLPEQKSDLNASAAHGWIQKFMRNSRT